MRFYEVVNYTYLLKNLNCKITINIKVSARLRFVTTSHIDFERFLVINLYKLLRQLIPCNFEKIISIYAPAYILSNFSCSFVTKVSNIHTNKS